MRGKDTAAHLRLFERGAAKEETQGKAFAQAAVAHAPSPVYAPAPVYRQTPPVYVPPPAPARFRY